MFDLYYYRLDSAEQEQIVMQQEKKNLELRMEKDIEEAKVGLFICLLLHRNNSVKQLDHKIVMHIVTAIQYFFSVSSFAIMTNYQLNIFIRI